MSGPTIECPCGTVLRGDDQESVGATARDHAKQFHDMDLSVDDARTMARPS